MASTKKLLVLLAAGNQTNVDVNSIVIECRSDNQDPIISSLISVSDASIDEVKSIGFLPNDDIQGQIFRLLKAKAKMSIEGCLPDRESGQSLAVDLKIQGFVDIMAAKDPASGERFIVCQKPDWDVGASANVSIPAASASASASSKWKMVADDLAEDDMVDENELLNDEYVNKPRGDVAACSSEDLPDDGSKRRACKNWSCGLAEEEAAAEASGKTLDASTAKSSCGNCYKGDAFRCSSCPFLGKPAFEAGNEKVVLSLGSDDF